MSGRRLMDVCATCYTVIGGAAMDCSGCDRVFCSGVCTPTGAGIGGLWSCGLCKEAIPAAVDLAQQSVNAKAGAVHTGYTSDMLSDEYFRLSLGKI
jgi:hypothetical protein